MNFKKAIVVLLALVAVLVMNACSGAGEEQVLKMGLIPADDAAEMVRNYQPVAVYLEEKLGYKVEIQVTNDYTSAIEAMRNGHIDLAWFGPFSYILAAREAGAEALVNGVRRDTGLSTYRSVIVTRSDSGIETMDDLPGRSFAFVDPASTSGNLIPRTGLEEAGISDRDFSTYFYAGSHNSVMLAVFNGKVDAGASSDNTYDRMVAAGQIDPSIGFFVWKSDPIPGSPIAVRGDLPEELKEGIRQALVDMSEQDIHQVEGWGNIEKYIAVVDSDYDIIRETARILDLG